MKTNPQQIADKATTRLVDDLDRTLASALREIAECADDKVEAAGARRARLDAQRQLHLKVTQALLAVGTIDEPVLARPLIAAQRQHRANLDRIESLKDDWAAFGECGAAVAAIDAFLAAAADAQGMTHWLRGTYRPTAGRTAAAVKTLRDDRCRRNLAAELEAIEAARSKAMVAGDVNGARHEPLAALRRIDKVVARIQAGVSRLAALVAREAASAATAARA